MVVLIGDSQPNVLTGSDGSDEIFGGGGDDILDTGSGGDDLIYGEDGDDLLISSARGSVVIFDGGDGVDTFKQDLTTENFANLPDDLVVEINLEQGVSGALGYTNNQDRLISIENITQVGYQDTVLTGDDQSNMIIGSFGSDEIFGGGGNDKIRGGEGTDTARYTNARSEYVVTTETGPEGQILYRVTSLDQSETSEGSDLLFSDIELLEFAGEVMTIEDALVPVTEVTEGQYSLTAIANVFGEVMFLDGLTETVTSSSHTIEYNGTTFDYAEVDGIITTVVRDGEFTSEFAAEIAESFPDSAGISYSTAVALIGQANIESTLLMVAGADGNYVG